MNRTSLSINEIKITDRQRLDLGDLQDLCSSIERFGLIQPIVVNQEKRLIAGGRRLAAFSKLGRNSIDVVFKETLTEADLFEMELEENVQRLDMAWQERCLNVAKIHETRLKQSISNGDSWTQRKTAELLQVASVSNINDMLRVARLLKAELPDKGRFWGCENMAEAVRLILRDREDELLAANATEQQAIANSTALEIQDNAFASLVTEVSTSPDLLINERTRYESNPLNTIPFEIYWQEKQSQAEEIRNTIYISNKLILGDSITFMFENRGRFDHIVTDIPYGIDMDMLNQQNPHGGMTNIDMVEELHDVQYNLDLITQFFPAAFAATKENAFVITWADQMLWQFMYDQAIKAGFAVQRWPITWYKQSQCMNQCAQYNTTKDTEIAIVCRKPGATLANKAQTSVISAARDELSESIRHPFAKPFACWEFLVNLCSIEGQTILEPFAGGGSGVISMLRMKRNVIAVEKEEVHYNELLENVKQYYLNLNPQFIFK